MATTYITLDNLSRAMERYDKTFKLYTDDRIKAFMHAITYDNQTRKLRFYDKPAPVPAGTQPFLEVTLPPDLDGLEDLFVVSLEQQAQPDQGKFRTYVMYQGQGADKTEIGRIQQEYDTAVTGGTVVEATPEHPIIIDGQSVTSGKFLRLTIKNQADPVYIALTDIGSVILPGDGISISQNNEISININSNHANGLAVDSNGLKMNMAEAPDATLGTLGSAGAMSASDKEILNSFSVATEAQIKSLFD